ncbi:ABC-type Fe3+-citrate transport system substrate-binding protein [Methanohalophilus levihalophilus]|uniref:hypothetical protein n=1 Tax=Methanohalophilus levihalophilus TaxID=1431282 RepID=UPI001AE8166E|nr:hypothetical protein [Methanohalophilus levihalophilus]MBP2029503.1 ABC-type Fe3+-citrate transport system substrate-binding protein [Methanohalophilus levihalophilus]
MKTTILILGIIMGLLLVSGCAQQTDIVEEGTTDEVVQEEIPEESSGDENLSNESEDLPISQEELDNLKEELEGLEFEDLGGLSE